MPELGPSLTVDTFAEQLLADGERTTVPVVDGGSLLGLVGIGQLRRIGRRRWSELRASDVMVAPPTLPRRRRRGRPVGGHGDAPADGPRRGARSWPGPDLLGILTRRGVVDTIQARVAAAGRRTGRVTVDASAADLLSVEEALAAVLGAIPGPLSAEELAPEAALGRWLAAPVVATTDLPPWDNSAMDGYAIRAADVAAATEDAPDPPRRRSARSRAGEIGRRARSRPGTAVPDRDRRAAPGRGGRGRPGRADDAARRAGAAAGSARPRGDRAAARRRAPCTRPVAAGWVRSAAGATTCGPVPTVLRGGDAHAAPARSPSRPAPARPSCHGPSAAARRRPGHRRRDPRAGDAARRRRASRTRTDPGLRALVASAGATPVALGIARDELDDVVGRLSRGASARSTRSSCAAASRSGRTTSSAARSRRVGRVDLWRVAVQPGKPFAFGTAERPDGAAAILAVRPARATRSRPWSPSSCSSGRRSGAWPASPHLRRDADRAVLARPRVEEPGPAGVPAGRRRARAGRRRPCETPRVASRSGWPAGRGATSSARSAPPTPSRSCPRTSR